MVRSALRYLGFFLILMFLQLFVFNNIQLSGYINPYVYILFILFLPYAIPGWLLLLLGFLVGLSMDAFMNTFGMHSSATLFIAFMRPYILSILSDREDVDKKGRPSMAINGFVWFLKYSLILVLAHHLMLFFIESFSFASFFATLWRVIVSTVTTTCFIIVIHIFTIRKNV